MRDKNKPLAALEFASLGSGSKGNATLVSIGDTCIMVDCGFSMRETVARLEDCGKQAEQLAAILLTHEHTDHIRGAGAMSRKFGIPIWSTRGTAQAEALGEVSRQYFINAEEEFNIGEVVVQAYPVPHDAREPCQYIFSNGKQKLGLLTDVGRGTPHIVERLSLCDALLLECNHDSEMLAEGEYPVSLKQRVAGDLGHLSNLQAAGILAQLDTSNLKYIAAMHISEKNNQVELAREALSEVLDCEHNWINIADQQHGLAWHKI
ncbi:Metal-dependent hydrolases of the beta-lactamase superfamily I [hydrothermal vent metagenome]|uniref:Metal-dependent hydrolases of the beta-lactamase superfamily I n=1 Tax=hydrothermal vent metagenome TaxID=652676 RepID=A0A3B1A8V5_9ZZZZ